MMQGKKIFITGGTGFIGSRLVEKLYLEHNASIRVLVRNFSRVSRIARFPIEMVSGDIRDMAKTQEAMKGCDIVFHCAYDFGVNPQQGQATDTEGAKNIARAALENGVGRVVHVGTTSVYGTLDGDLDENSPRQASKIDSYQNTKLLSENIMLEYYEKHKLPVSIVEPTIVYGPFSRPWTISVVDQLSKGVIPLPDDGGGYCNAVYIDDVIDGMILAATKDEAIGERFLLSAREPITWREFYGAFERILEIESVICVPAKELMSTSDNGTSPNQPQPIISPSVRARWVKLLKNPEFRMTLIDTPVLNWPYLVAKKSPLQTTFVGKMWEQRVTQQVQKSNIPSPPKPAPKSRPKPPFTKPHPTRLALLQAKTRVRIDKARRLLGYQPVFDFEDGMALNAEFIRWYIN
jgi:nucleoside-diphosphate-sugar epimerase